MRLRVQILRQGVLILLSFASQMGAMQVWFGHTDNYCCDTFPLGGAVSVAFVRDVCLMQASKIASVKHRTLPEIAGGPMLVPRLACSAPVGLLLRLRGGSGDVEEEAEASAASDSSSSTEKEPQMEFDTQSKEAQEAWAETRY